MAIQLSSFRLGTEVVLHFTTVLDTYEFGAEPEEVEPVDPATRGDWEKKTNPASLAVVDRIMALTPSNAGTPRVTYNMVLIALGTTGYNFCWFHPRRTASHCHMHIKIALDDRQGIIDRLEEAGIDASNHGRSSIRLKLSTKDIDDNEELVREVVQMAEEFSHR
jgi:hypothetical protein